MTDKVYPASKPNPPPPMNGSSAGPAPAGVAPPAAKPQLYNPNRPRPVYRPQSDRSRRRCSGRRFCCLCFIYTLILILSLLLLAAIAACVFYVLYHPKHPTFSVSSVRISTFNLSNPTDPSSASFFHLTSKLDFTLSAKNPNSKISFVYDQFLVDVTSAGGVDAGNGTLPAFPHSPGNTTILKGTVASDPGRDLDSDSVKDLKSDLKKKSGFPLTVQVDTKVEVKMGKLKTKKVGIRVTCEGMKGFVPKRNATSKKTTPALGSTSDAKCKVDLRIKIWKFTF